MEQGKKGNEITFVIYRSAHSFVSGILRVSGLVWCGAIGCRFRMKKRPQFGGGETGERERLTRQSKKVKNNLPVPRASERFSRSTMLECLTMLVAFI